MEELAQPARKTFRGGRRGRGRGRDRHGQQRRQAATAEAPRQEERAEEDEEGHDCARGEGEDQGADLEEMLRAIKVVNAGQRYISPEIAQTMALRPYVPTHHAPLDMLSERELQIMMLIVNCHKVQDVADQLCLSPKTVNTYRYRIFDKLGISSDVEMALVAVRHGMVDANELNPA